MSWFGDWFGEWDGAWFGSSVPEYEPTNDGGSSMGRGRIAHRSLPTPEDETPIRIKILRDDEDVMLALNLCCGMMPV
jgi:hypothetical protein